MLYSKQLFTPAFSFFLLSSAIGHPTQSGVAMIKRESTTNQSANSAEPAIVQTEESNPIHADGGDTVENPNMAVSKTDVQGTGPELPQATQIEKPSAESKEDGTAKELT